MVEVSPSWLAQSEEEAVGIEAIALARVLAGGGDPASQLVRAKALLAILGGLGRLLEASPEQLAEVGILEKQEVALLVAIQRLGSARGPVEQPEISSFGSLQMFLRAKMAETGPAETRALLLEERHRLRADVILARGEDPLSCEQHRHLVRACIEHRAGGVIIVRRVRCTESLVLDTTREANTVAPSLEMLGTRLLDYVLVAASEIRRVPWWQASHMCRKQ